MELTKKISILVFVLFLYACSTTDKGVSQLSPKDSPSPHVPLPLPLPPLPPTYMAKLQGSWIVTRKALHHEDPVKDSTIVFNEKGICIYKPNTPNRIKSDVTYTPIEEVTFTDKPGYSCYIYEQKFLEVSFQTYHSKEEMFYLLLWSDGTNLMRSVVFDSVAEVKDRLNCREGKINSTDIQLTIIFATKKK